MQTKFDALERAVEQNPKRSVHRDRLGEKFAFMSGQAVRQDLLPFVAGTGAVYNGTGLHRFWTSDWQGSQLISSDLLRSHDSKSQQVSAGGARPTSSE